jgi:probable HAF family extracellular repeat protein
MQRFLRCWLAFLVASWVTGAALSHAMEYIFQSINYPGADQTSVFDINDAGHVVGSYQVGSIDYGFFYDGTEYTTIAVSGAEETMAYGINNAGHIVGTYEDSEENQLGFLYNGTDYTTIAVPGSDETFACGINDNGQIIGFCDAGTFIYDGNDYQIIDIPISFLKNDINNAGQIVGNFLLGVGEVAYICGFLYEGGHYITLYNIGVSTLAMGINDAGLVVGSYGDEFFAFSHGFIDDGTDYQTIDMDGASMILLMGINNAGEIVGFYEDSLENRYGLLATPIPLPGSFLLLGSGLLGLGLWGRRRRQS